MGWCHSPIKSRSSSRRPFLNLLHRWQKASDRSETRHFLPNGVLEALVVPSANAIPYSPLSGQKSPGGRDALITLTEIMFSSFRLLPSNRKLAWQLLLFGT